MPHATLRACTDAEQPDTWEAPVEGMPGDLTVHVRRLTPDTMRVSLWRTTDSGRNPTGEYGEIRLNGAEWSGTCGAWELRAVKGQAGLEFRDSQGGRRGK